MYLSLTLLACFLLLCIPQFPNCSRFKVGSRIISVAVLSCYLLVTNHLHPTTTPLQSVTTTQTDSTIQTPPPAPTKSASSSGSTASTTAPSATESHLITTVTQDDYKKILFTDTNLRVISLLGAILLACVGVFILSLPLLDFSEISILGNSVKIREQVAKSEAVAMAEMENQLAIEQKRASILLGISDPVLFDIQTCFDTSQTFQPKLALDKLAAILKAGYSQLHKDIHTLVLDVNNGQVQGLDQLISNLPARKLIKETVDDALQKMDTDIQIKSKHSVLAMPIPCVIAPSYLLVLISTDLELLETDEMTMKTAWKMIEANRVHHALNLQGLVV